MKHSLLILSLTFLTTLFITTYSQAQETLYTKTISVSGPKNNEKKDSTFVAVTDGSFAISLNSLSNDTRFRAQRAVHRSKITEPFHWVTLILAHADGTDVYFKDAADFIQYMDVHGYVVESETKQRYSTDYVFRKK
ncbi:MAG TPA: hypothetical protein VGK59_23480 [Ohtaekwangia sp.]